MKIYKFDYKYNNEHRCYFRLADVPYGKFLGFYLDEDKIIKAKIEMNIAQDKGCYSFHSEISLKENDTFEWNDESLEEDGSILHRGVASITLVKVEAEDEDVFTLYNGVQVPRLGYGTWLIQNEDAKTAVRDAINAGYIHIDSAQAYGNEEGVGIGIKNAIFPREDIFITTKVHADLKNYEDAKKSIEESLKRLDVDYIDLMIIHCPMPWPEYSARGGFRYLEGNLGVWKALSEAYEAKKIRAIGVSNFNIDDIKNIMNNAPIKPMVNQIPIWLGELDKELIEFCMKNNIMVESYSPLGHGRLIDKKVKDAIYPGFIKVFKEYKEYDWAQILLSFASTYSDIVLPKSMSLPHILSNMKYVVTLSQEAADYLEEKFASLDK